MILAKRMILAKDLLESAEKAEDVDAAVLAECARIAAKYSESKDKWHLINSGGVTWTGSEYVTRLLN